MPCHAHETSGWDLPPSHLWLSPMFLTQSATEPFPFADVSSLTWRHLQKLHVGASHCPLCQPASAGAPAKAAAMVSFLYIYKAPTFTWPLSVELASGCFRPSIPASGDGTLLGRDAGREKSSVDSCLCLRDRYVSCASTQGELAASSAQEMETWLLV